MRTIFYLQLCIAAANSLIGLNPVPNCLVATSCIPPATITPVPGEYGCFSFSITGTFNSTSYYVWDFGDNTTAVGNHVFHCYSSSTAPTNYTVTVSYISPMLCGPLPMQDTYTLSLNQSPPYLCISNTPSITIAASSVTLSPGPVIPEIVSIYSYGDSTSATSQNTHTYAACGNYIVEVKTKFLNINPPDSCYTYKAVNIPCFTPDATGIGTNSVGTDVTRLFPNPVSSIIYLIPGKTFSSISVTNSLGEECLWQTETNVKPVTLNVSEFRPGIYFIKLIYEDNRRENLKFIKE